MGLSALQSITLPDGPDPANVPLAMAEAIADTEKRLVMRFATAALRDGAIPTPESGMMVILTDDDRLTLYDGTGWVTVSEPVQSYTPTIGGTGWALGTTGASATGQFQRASGRVFIAAQIVFGTGMTAGSGALTISTPPGITLSTTVQRLGRSRLVDIGTNQYAGDCITASSSTLQPRHSSPVLSVTTTSPFAWTAGDIINVEIDAPMTTRYL
jgi:hypothetical protein